MAAATLATTPGLDESSGQLGHGSHERVARLASQ